MKPLRVGQFVEYDCSRQEGMIHHAVHNGSIGIVMGPGKRRPLDNAMCYPIKWMVRMSPSTHKNLALRDFNERDAEGRLATYPRYLLRRSKYAGRTP